MHEDLLAQAVLPEPRIVCKLPMRRYSLGHELFLIRRQNPLLLMAQDEFNKLPFTDQVRSILNAADICSQSWRELNYSPRNFSERFRLRRIWKKWDRALRHENYPLQIAEFRNYLAEGHLDFPGKIPEDSEGEIRYIGAPELLRLYQFIGKTVPASEIAFYSQLSTINHQPSAWDYPLALARMQMSAHNEAEGGWTIYNWRDKVHDEYVAQREAERAAAGEKEPGIVVMKADGTIVPFEPAPEIGKEEKCQQP